MSEQIRISVGADGELTSSKGLDRHGVDDFKQPIAEENASDAPPTPLVKIGGVPTRWTAEEGITVRRPSSAVVKVGVTEHGVSVLGANGMPTTLDQAGPDAVVDLPGLGTSSALVYHQLGYIKKHPSGRGYIVNDAMIPELSDSLDAQDAAAEKKVTEANDGAEITAEGIPGTSTAADIAHRNIRQAIPASTYQGAVQALILTGDVPDVMLNAIASHTQQTTEEARGAMQFIMSEYDATARAVATKAGVPADAYNDFLAWAAGNENRDTAMNAFLDLTERHQITRLAKLAKAYTRARAS
jgi:hypothetical protein